MNTILKSLGALALTSTLAQAGGIDRSGQSILPIFEKGNYAELSFGSISPSVSGVAVAALGGFSSGDMAPDYTQYSLAVKTSLSANLDFGLILDQPFGADVAYPVLAAPPAVYYAAGSTAKLTTSALTAIVKYRTAKNISVYGGLRYQTMQARARIPFIPGGGYNVASSSESDLGYLVGVAFEKPEIALRVALTYNSKIKHAFDTIETSVFTGGVPTASVTNVATPQSVNLDFQSGVNKKTLVFGSIRWVDWSSFNINPPFYPPAGPLVSYDKDTITYSLGVGRKLSENWSAAVTLGFEKATGGFASNLGPTDGKKSISVGASYTKNNMKISGGVSYVDIGDTQTTLGAGAAANFSGNKATAFGLKISYAF